MLPLDVSRPRSRLYCNPASCSPLAQGRGEAAEREEKETAGVEEERGMMSVGEG